MVKADIWHLDKHGKGFSDVQWPSTWNWFKPVCSPIQFEANDAFLFKTRLQSFGSSVLFSTSSYYYVHHLEINWSISHYMESMARTNFRVA